MTPTRAPKLHELPWKYIMRRSLHEFTRNDCMDLAAGLTYYAVLSLVPGLLAVVSVLGLVGQAADSQEAMLGVVQQFVPGEAGKTATQIISGLSATGGSGITLIIGIVTALWSASGYVGAFGRAGNRLYGVREGRPFYVLKPVLLIVTFFLVLCVVLIIFMAALSGSIAQTVGSFIGLGPEAAQIWDLAKLPAVILLAILMVGLLYHFTPNIKHARFRLLSPGAAFAFLAMVLASVGFGFYVAYFSKYPNTYGALAGVIVMLLWIWIINNTLLLGLALDAEVTRGRQLERGIDAEKEIRLPARSDKMIAKLDEAQENLISEAREIRLRPLHEEHSVKVPNLPASASSATTD
ncbi:YihY/virulence factor BrkB family protein [Dermabacteraceae bacterium P7074]